ncbi:MAG: hypothetical protein ACYC6Y_15245 [Thermoguttaceae bacterium]
MPMWNDGPAADWHALIDNSLIAWSCNPSLCEDEGLTPPSENVIHTALQWAQVFVQQNLPAPDRVVPDPDGGIVFERHVGAMVEVLHIWDDASVEIYRLQDGHMIERFPISNP